MSAESDCSVCRQPSHLRCANCHRAAYCSKDHQKIDWKNHKKDCLPYKVVSNEELGRHLVATRAISEGEIIIQEPPIISGPPQETPPLCLGCYVLINVLNRRECSRCGWPVCSEICERSPSHRPECDITYQYKNGKVKINTFDKNLPHPSYQCLTVLRCLYLKKAHPKLWSKLMNLESHCEERKATVKYNSDQLFIANFIPKFFNFNEFSNEEISRVAGIVQVNAHEVPLGDPGYISIYEKASLLEHSCRANCMKSFTNSGDLVIRAASRIAPGDHLSICYTDPLWGRQARMDHLLETKFFSCRCLRCSDPTEFGTHFNSLKCFDGNCTGYVIPVDESPACKAKSRPKVTWTCRKCGNDFSEETRKLLSEASEALTLVDKKNAKSCKEFIHRYEGVLHPNHHLLVAVKMALIDLLGWQDKLLSLKEDDLRWAMKACKDMYDLATSLVPAENRLRGVLLYQWQFVLTEHDRRRMTRMEIDASQMKKNMKECRDILLKAYKLLSYEPDELPEGKMAVEAKKALQNMNEYLKS